MIGQAAFKKIESLPSFSASVEIMNTPKIDTTMPKGNIKRGDQPGIYPKIER